MEKREKSDQRKNKKGGLRARSQKIKAKALKSYYGNPMRDMKLIAITGTTGKTTVAHFVHEILRASGEQVAVLASDQPFKMGMLHKFLSDAWKAGANYVVVTVPAEGLRDNVFYGLPVSVAAMTNFVTASLSDMEPEEYLDNEKTLFDMNFVRVNCGEHFISKLKGVVDPEEKRKIIGTEFFKVFWDEIKKQKDKGYFAQGTIYPDCIESGKGNAAVIKTHHNRVGVPDDVEFLGILEPLKDLFKDEVRVVGERLGLPKELVWRQPFPGPGLGIRIIGEITEEKIKLLQEADYILRDEMSKNGYEKNLSQFFCALPDVKTVGVMGDFRTYDNLVIIRAITTDDFMTADWAKIPYEILQTVSNRITNECKGINRVVYDITSKPPATVEYE